MTCSIESCRPDRNSARTPAVARGSADVRFLARQGGKLLAAAWNAGWRNKRKIFCVFDQTATGAWTLVHGHFAV